MSKRRHSDTLLAWASVGGGQSVLLDVLQHLRGRGVHIGRVMYLLQSADMPLPTQVELGDIQLEKILITVSDPTHHQVIHAGLKQHVLPRLRSLTGTLHINVSAGTPAMHAMWLLLHAGGAFPEGTKLWSPQRDKSGKTRLDPVDFRVDTYLAEIRRAAAASPTEGRYDPECRSPARRKALATLASYARVPRAPLLLLGERGTGKTRVVETFLGPLKGRSNVITVACGTLDPALAMSALFGHKRGSFTGANADHAGYLEQARDGVLFLDEVQDLEARVQRQLVRVLQDPRRRFRRIGDGAERESNAEIVCASHLTLEELRNRIDADLFDRISLLLVEIPPLRDCRQDLRDDWQQVWREARSFEEVPVDAPWNDALGEALNTAPLRGNLRDLQRLAFILMARCTGGSTRRWLEEGITEWTALQARFEAVENGGAGVVE
ncbi:MAG TPA: sigma 54-interacting transcriptional regulator, partial [Polyangium sp.]|nr:sigma 54-interacting transcriptional regulator [Polyangium sp.]